MKNARRILSAAALLLSLTAGGALAQGATQTYGPTGTDDEINCDGGRCEGTDGDDTIVASNKAERVFAKAGNDDIELDAAFPGGSSDDAFGGRGRDCIDGGGGADLMVGGPGNDNRPCEFTAFVDPEAAMTGGPGNDTIKGRGGDDSMNGIFDDDMLRGGAGDDLVQDPSPDDEDTLRGGPGRDTLDATDGDGNDVVRGGRGTDDCSGDKGDRFENCERVQRT